MNFSKYNPFPNNTNICNIKHNKQIIKYEHFHCHKMFRINKFKNTYSTELYNCLHNPRYPTFSITKY